MIPFLNRVTIQEDTYSSDDPKLKKLFLEFFLVRFLIKICFFFHVDVEYIKLLKIKNKKRKLLNKFTSINIDQSITAKKYIITILQSPVTPKTKGLI